MITTVGEILKLERRWLEPAPAESYTQIGIRSFGNGIFHKPAVKGVELGTKRVLRIEAGDLILSNVFAWEGAIAVASAKETGTIGSHRYVTLVPKYKDACDVEYLQYYFTTGAGAGVVRKASPGSAGRNRTLGIERFLQSTIDIPDAPQQRVIVARLRQAHNRASEILDATEQLRNEAEDICRSILANAAAKPTPLSELLRPRQPDVIVQPGVTYPFAGVYSFGRGVFRAPDRDGMEISYDRLTRLHVGDLVYPKLMAWEGAIGIVPPACDGCMVSTEFPVFEPIDVLPEVLDVHFKTPSVRSALATLSTGTNLRRRRLHPERFLKYLFPLPSSKVQERIRAAYQFVENIQRLTDETRSDVTHFDDAFLASELARR